MYNFKRYSIVYHFVEFLLDNNYIIEWIPIKYGLAAQISNSYANKSISVDLEDKNKSEQMDQKSFLTYYYVNLLCFINFGNM